MYWILWIFIIGASSCQFVDAQGHRVAPGVHPQHYQQQFPSQQMHHVPQHQVPQQQYQQVQQQQVPVQQQGHDHVHPQQLLSAANIAQEKAHIAEHLDVPMDTSKMSEQELQFHYFKMHDADNNNKLDGCELIKSLIHWHGTSVVAGVDGYEDHELEFLVDKILKEVDTDFDGQINWTEYSFNLC
ncbi:multiple coagulation factor deficiency protein 2 homolog isoform X2 [Cephus cinctus]|uniref:Multiple coagulation factor deficiency protein 2 homolog isoform X2 n=1 Tax=Cephus cinctus TaxID=211228 RepID=A0AAJ7FKF3_CEPCN|nr:multiple coagulation factor deficiency protein 2 homolog isoform X2 [Cephus cinctus]